MSEVADVPRTRVYDAADELHDRGLVDGDGDHSPEPRDETAIWGPDQEQSRRAESAGHLAADGNRE